MSLISKKIKPSIIDSGSDFIALSCVIISLPVSLLAMSNGDSLPSAIFLGIGLVGVLYHIHSSARTIRSTIACDWPTPKRLRWLANAKLESAHIEDMRLQLDIIKNRIVDADAGQLLVIANDLETTKGRLSIATAQEKGRLSPPS